jgi:serine/threonine protein kinase/DNA-binding XRE family transcriptional regulator
MIAEATFGQIVRERRLGLGLTQAELARRVNCATVTIRKIEYDNLRPSVQVAERLALSLNIPEAEQLAFVRLARTDLPQMPIPTPAPMPEEIGQEDLSGRSVHGYELGERIGTGGFGVVYRAVQPSVDRDVAIKIILPEYANHPNFIRRFEVEAQTIAQLEHPHIVPLYDYWREPNAAYLIMRLLRGGSLESKIKRGSLPLAVINRYLQQIGQGLYLAHRNGVIHRDLKPANILLDEDDNAYLADFGIAKHLDEWTAVDKTEMGALVGSPAYASPEQLRAERIKPQTDIYCLGIMLYELLAGERPFPGPTPVLYIQQHLFELLPPISQQNAALPPALDEILLQATAKDPASPVFMIVKNNVTEKHKK